MAPLHVATLTVQRELPKHETSRRALVNCIFLPFIAVSPEEGVYGGHVTAGVIQTTGSLVRIDLQ